MEPPLPRPKLSLKFKSNATQADSTSQPQTPAETPVRTPSLKIRFAGSTVATPSEDGGSTKKRKRDGPSVEPEPAIQAQPKNKVMARLKLNTSSLKLRPPGKASASTPAISLKTKGKIPKRPLGVGYDSELEDREQDPVILESVILRMHPGPDCDYVRDSIANGMVGVSVMQGGARINLRFFDVNGRRGILTVRNNYYAISTVDLPTITEGMKSWDRKTFVKSVDISQMILVLGPCKDEDEARHYELPADVNPKTYKYAHGLTAPMHNVRVRRYGRTARARVDDIEAIERKVAAMIDADTRAYSFDVQTFDEDPRLLDDEDAEAEDDDAEAEAEETDGYFPHVEEAEEAEEPEFNYDEAELEAMFDNSDADDSGLQTGTQSVDISAAPSPAADDTPADHDDDDDDDHDGDNDDEGGQSDAEEKSEQLAEIKRMEARIANERELLKAQNNHILKKKIAKRILEYEQDLRMRKRVAGIAEQNDGDSEEE